MSPTVSCMFSSDMIIFTVFSKNNNPLSLMLKTGKLLLKARQKILFCSSALFFVAQASQQL